jgi:tetratricopeptide (TPR) repeat protein
MPDSDSVELKRAAALILEKKMDEALYNVRKIEEKAWMYYNKRDYNETISLALKCKELYHKIGNKISIANNFYLLGRSYIFTGDYDTSLNYGQKCLKIFEELNNQEGIANGLFLVGLAYNYKGKFNHAIDFLKQSLSIDEIVPRTKVEVLYILGVVHFWKGELDDALKNCENSLKIADELDLKIFIALNLTQIGAIYQFKGETERAKDIFERSLLIAEEHEFTLAIGISLGSLTRIAIDTEDTLEDAKKYNERLRVFSEKYKTDRYLNHMYLFGKAIIILSSGARTQERAEAELILNQIVKEKISNPIPHIYAIISLCEFLIEELKMSNDIRVLDEINPLVNRLLNITEKTHSYIWLVRSKLVQSKLALIQMEFKESKILISQAQQIAESHDLQIYAQVISNEHDQLLEQQDMWEHLKKTKAPMTDRINLASFDGVIAQLQGRTSIDTEELVDEQSILLMIISEGGVLVFSYPFSDEWKFDDELFGGFLTAFNSISDEIFSEGLDRVKFGKQTVLMENVANFSFCYLFKGQTYPAKQKFDEFIKRIQNNSSIFQTLEKYYKTNQVAELADIPSIEPLIQEIFITKS